MSDTFTITCCQRCAASFAFYPRAVQARVVFHVLEEELPSERLYNQQFELIFTGRLFHVFVGVYIVCAKMRHCQAD